MSDRVWIGDEWPDPPLDRKEVERRLDLVRAAKSARCGADLTRAELDRILPPPRKSIDGHASGWNAWGGVAPC